MLHLCSNLRHQFLERVLEGTRLRLVIDLLLQTDWKQAVVDVGLAEAGDRSLMIHRKRFNTVDVIRQLRVVPC